MTSPLLSNRPPRLARDAVRPQITDLPMENIAEMAVRAQQLGDVIPLWYGEGDVVTPAFIRDAAKAAFDAGMTFYIPNMRGYGPLSEGLAAYQSKLHGRDIGIERTTVTPGGMQSLAMAMELILDLGQNAVYIEPQWPNIRSMIHLVGAEPRPVSLDFVDNDWKLDLDKVFKACDARTRAIVFSTPANPTGWVASAEELQALLAFSRERGIWIISDEVYARLYFDGPVAPSILQFAEPEDLVMTINSFSKAWAMTGWRVGWLTHPSSVAAQVAAMTQYINSGTAGPLQAGAHAALTKGEPLAAEMRDRCKNGIALAMKALSKVSGITLPDAPRGGMYVFFSIPGHTDSREACRHVLDTARVGLAPGFLFGRASNAFLRLCICRDPKQLDEALGRIVKALG
jgi:aspartate aminotransferase